MADHSPDMAKFLQLVEEVVKLSAIRLSTEPVTWKRECYQKIRDNFVQLSGDIRNGSDHLADCIGGGAGLGVTRAISEWDLRDDQMYRVAADAERYFKNGRFGVSE